ncbi:MAG: transposase, partial [Planctomycetaceae bacterium]|nr:transposase [Planctomycetaceae bacterium]
TGSRTAPKSFVSDSQWKLIQDLFEDGPPSAEGGRPRVDPRACLEGILWILKNGARWQDLPDRYPSPATCWRRHRDWTESGVLFEAWRRLLRLMDRRKLLDWSQAMGDGTFSPAKKGGLRLARPKRERVPSSC